jgi:hypothetical protein
MEKIDLGKYQPSCFLAHEHINKLAVIIGRCDLLQEGVEENSQLSSGLTKIRELAQVMADELKQHQCEVDAITRAEAIKKAAARSS